MQTRKLGRTDIEVSRICLGTMTWGSLNTQAEGHLQMDYALERGVNFWDTAEMYPIMSNAEIAGNTEKIIGNWLAKNPGRRSEIVLATKITGKGNMSVRGGRGINAREIPLAVEGSLARLQSDYIDLYQFHWPQRGSYHFQQQWNFGPHRQGRQEAVENLHESLQALQGLVNEGKIRAFGLSDDSVWGLMQLLKLSEEHDLPRVHSVQNEYSLLCRLFDTDWAEAAHHEDVGLLAWSPLAMGLLSGKYLDGKLPAGSRKAAMDGLSRETEPALNAIARYVEIAKRYGMDPSQMAIAFTLSRPFTTASIIGASGLDQLKNAIDADQLKLSDDLLKEIGDVHRLYPMPF